MNALIVNSIDNSIHLYFRQPRNVGAENAGQQPAWYWRVIRIPISTLYSVREVIQKLFATTNLLLPRYKVFIDLFNMSTFLVPRHLIPPLTPQVIFIMMQ